MEERVTRNETLKQVMLGLIYPAVLGSVFYNFLGAAIEPFVNRILGRPAVLVAPWLKWVLLFTTLVFYCCDYLYIMFTREFVALFFVCDLILLAGLYVTFSSIDIRAAALPHRNVVVVGACYCAFMTLYLAWDIFEKSRTKEPKEQWLYKHVILWEVVSLIMIVVWLGLETWVPNFSRDVVFLTAILVLITIWFAVLALKKRDFYRPLGQPEVSP
jgi:hypothetical protein